MLGGYPAIPTCAYHSSVLTSFHPPMSCGQCPFHSSREYRGDVIQLGAFLSPQPDSLIFSEFPIFVRKNPKH